MSDEEPKPRGEFPESPAPENSSPAEVWTTNPDEIFADWSEMPLTRAVLYAAALLAAAAVLVLVLILLNIL